MPTYQKSIPSKKTAGTWKAIGIVPTVWAIWTLFLFSGNTATFAQPEVKTLYVSTIPKYQPLLDYLNSQIPGYHFVLVDVPISRMIAAAQQRKFDFVLAAPTHFVILNVTFGATAIATRRDMVRPGVFTNFIGGVLLCPSENTAIRQLADLRNKKIAAIDPLALGGWISVGRELKEAGIEPESDIRTEFRGNADRVIDALRQGQVDAGVVASGTVERFLDSGKIRPGEFRILSPPEDQPEALDFPFLHSTRLYPATAFTALPHVPETLVRKVAIAILRLPEDSPVVRSTQTAWSLPIGYQSVHQAMQIMRVTPYQDYGKVTLLGAIGQHWEKVMTALATLIGLLVTLLFRMANLNRKLTSSRMALQREFELHRISQEQRLESEVRFHSIFDNSAVGICLTDAGGRILESNVALQEMLGYDSNELIDRSAESLTHPDDFPQERILFQELLDNHRISYQLDKRCLCKAGESLWVHFTASLVRSPQGKILWGIFVIEKITLRKQAEEERDRLIADLQKALQEVHTLSGLLPICANCKKVRDDQGYWQLVEEFIGDRAPVQFSHSICPSCMSKLYPEFCIPDENDPTMERPERSGSH
jgi:PAS domain S-box-containing protein